VTTLVIDPVEFSGRRTIVEGDAHRHLFRARRLGPGDRLRVVDGLGAARWAEVASVERFRAELELGAEAPSNEAPARLELLVAALRPERASWLVEKAIEVGVAGVRFVVSKRAPRRYGGAHLERLERVARAAVEQCGRARLPRVTFHRSWSEVPDLLRDRVVRVLDPGAGEGSLEPLARGAEATLAIGPEGGWTEAELGELERLGGRPVGLGPRVLRVETAAVVGAAAMLLKPRGC
jgi:16S rRNA (uracil1498-N3)-methyltransferase